MQRVQVNLVSSPLPEAEAYKIMNRIFKFAKGAKLSVEGAHLEKNEQGNPTEPVAAPSTAL